MKRIITSSVVSVALAFSLTVSNTSYENSTLCNFGSANNCMVQHENKNNNNSSTIKSIPRVNWHELSMELFKDSKSFNKEEAKAHARVLTKVGVVKRKVFDI